MLKLPQYIEPFDFLQFVTKQANLMHVFGYMEIQLSEYKQKFPDKDLSESEDRINILREHHEFLYRLESEYNAVIKQSMENNLANLILTNEVEKLRKENETLKQQIKF